MKASLILASLLALSPFSSAENTKNLDSALFKDGGSFNGNFLGFSQDGKVLWKRDGSDKPQEFNIKELSQITIDGQRPKLSSPQHGVLHLINGDKMPAQLLQINDKEITVETTYSGKISIDLKFVTSFKPIPLGDDVLIRGFNDNQKWVQSSYSSYRTNNPQKGKWQKKGASWYADLKEVGLLYNSDLQLPDDFVCTFELSQIGNGSLTVMLHADLKKPLSEEQIKQLNKKGKEKIQLNNGSGAGNTVGNSLLLRIRNGYLDLSSSIVDENNQSSTRRCRSTTSYSNNRTGFSNTKKVELRVSRTNKEVIAYVDGIKKGEWNISELNYPKNGTILGFLSRSRSNANVRISNLTVSKWSGIKETPLSLINQSKDIILLTNDTDRFSGKIEKVQNAELYLKTSYANIKVPLKSLRTINLAQAKKQEIERDSKDITIKFYNGGSITGKLVSNGDSKAVTIKTPYNAKISVPMHTISSIELEEVSALINSWNKKH